MCDGPTDGLTNGPTDRVTYSRVRATKKIFIMYTYPDFVCYSDERELLTIQVTLQVLHIL